MFSLTRRAAFALAMLLILTIGAVHLKWWVRWQMPVYALPEVCGDGDMMQFAETSPFAYVTYLATVDYLLGLEALLTSIFRTNTSHPVVVLVTSATIAAAELHFPKWAARCGHNISRIVITEVEHIHGPNKGLKYKRYVHNWTKLRIFLLPYKKVIFLDADLVVLHNLDHLFDLPNQLGAISGAVADRLDDLNSGMLVISPCKRLFDSMLIKLHEVDFSFQFTQRFFVHYFGRNNILWLPRRYNSKPADNDPLDGAYVAHMAFSGHHLKPWQRKDTSNPWIAKWREFATCSAIENHATRIARNQVQA